MRKRSYPISLFQTKQADSLDLPLYVTGSVQETCECNRLLAFDESRIEAGAELKLRRQRTSS